MTNFEIFIKSFRDLRGGTFTNNELLFIFVEARNNFIWEPSYTCILLMNSALDITAVSETNANKLIAAWRSLHCDTGWWDQTLTSPMNNKNRREALDEIIAGLSKVQNG
jgi:hypothetical protein